MTIKQNLLVIDFNNLMFRSLSIMRYSSSNPILFETEDECAAFAAKLVQDILYLVRIFHTQGSKVVLACDSPNSWRKELYPNYKEGRQKPDINLKNIYDAADKLKAVLAKRGFVVLCHPQAEGDDIIAICKRLVWDEPEFANTNIIIISADADVRQLVDYQQWSEKSCTVFNEIGRPPHGYRKWYMSKGTIDWLNSEQDAPNSIFDFSIDYNRAFFRNIVGSGKKIAIEECDGDEVVLNKSLCGDDSDAIQGIYWCYGKTGKRMKVSPGRYDKIVETLGVHSLQDLDKKVGELKPVLETIFKKRINDVDIEERYELQKKLVWLNPDIFPESIRNFAPEAKRQILLQGPTDLGSATVQSLLKGTCFETATDKRRAKEADIFEGMNKYIDNLKITELF